MAEYIINSELNEGDTINTILNKAKDGIEVKVKKQTALAKAKKDSEKKKPKE